MKPKRPSVGDCYSIPLPDGRSAHGQYVYWDEGYGPLSRIFSVISRQPVMPDQLIGASLLFPAVFIGFGSVFKDGLWRVIGSMPVGMFVFPKFRFSFGTRPGRYHDWKIYDGKELRWMGDLPEELRSLEFLCGWSPQAIEDRILTGRDWHDQIR